MPTALLCDVPPGTLVRVVAGGRPLVLVNTGSGVHALADACLRSGESLAAGVLSGTTIRCAHSGWRYDVTTGAVLGVPLLYLDVHDVRVARGRVHVAREPRTRVPP
ncbi:MAG: Rieske 2Fe-2S domain-containing protein [Proteobacteria bacterium]|nr:Rieske 2Fe-2S domain-containing protein [Pseudomonadota bacterium]